MGVDSRCFVCFRN